MENEKKIDVPESNAMNGGDGAYSYAQNSRSQRGFIEAAKEIINEAIAKKFDIKTPSAPLNSIRVADLGCSTGPNTFLAVKNIIDAIKLKYQSEDFGTTEISEFQVFFNDRVSNDFNTLFTSLPPHREYLAAGVPGSFYDRLFPKATIHIFHSSNSLNWLSKVPKEVTDKTSPAWNKGRIHYTNAAKEVADAYATQYAMDMESFLCARAQELVVGGLMTLFTAAVPDNILPSDIVSATHLDLLGSCLMDMAKMGLVSEAKVDSFNLPIYFSFPKELIAIFERNGRFSIESIKELDIQDQRVIKPSVQMLTFTLRAGLEGVIEKHFGNDIMDEVFDRFSKKVANSSIFLNPSKTMMLSVLLKCKPND